jgi:hypothetical protein
MFEVMQERGETLMHSGLKHEKHIRATLHASKRSALVL